MKRVFADTCYWIAWADPKDQWAASVSFVRKARGEVEVVTTDVLTEFLNYFSRAGETTRRVIAWMVRSTLHNPKVTVIPQTHSSFLAGLALYEKRLDKGYSLTDCVSMSVMDQEGIAEALTTDVHFRQEGFGILMQ